MVGMALRKYAEAHSMRCDGGCIYGEVNGRHIAMLDANGVKMLQIYLYPPMQQADAVLLLQVKKILESDEHNEYRMLRRNAVNVGDGRAVVVFQDGPGAMKRIGKYIDAVVPRLEEVPLESGACSCCGKNMDEPASYLRIDDLILPAHRECIDPMAASADKIRPDVKKGSVLRGIFGAFLGAGIGAALWMLVYLMGYIVFVVGMAIGFAANFLYEKFGGRRGRTQLVVVMLAVFFGVLLGQAAGETARMVREYDGTSGFGAPYQSRAQYVQSMWEIILLDDHETALGNLYDRMQDSAAWNASFGDTDREEFIRTAWDAETDAAREEIIASLNGNFGMGILFALVGCIRLLTRLTKESGRRCVKPLK